MTMLELLLLGRPSATRDGHPIEGVRGTKAWTLLAYLLLAGGPVDRRRLATLFFPDAADPAAALRWNLSHLRRGLGVALDGDPVSLTLPEGAQVDLDVLANGDVDDAVSVARLARPLLDGAAFAENEPLATWLEGERRHLVTLSADVLREGAVSRLSRGDATGAAVLAEQVVELDPFDENAAVLLVRALREAGRALEARAVLERTTERLREELGVEPSSALLSAAHASVGGATRGGGRPAVEARLAAGEAALAAGVPDPGLDTLREALGGARAVGDADLLARCLTALGSGLIHAVRGSDQDGLALLHEAIPIAASAGLAHLSALANRELGYVDLLRGRYARAQRWFDVATEHASGDDEELAWIGAFAGAARTDVADYATATAMLDEAVGRAGTSGSRQAAAMAHAMRGRLRMLVEDDAEALADLEAAAAIARDVAWRSFEPWPQTMRAEVVRRRGDIDGAASILEPALATSRQVADPCWEAMALRGLGLTTVGDDLAAGLELLEDAPRQCRRLPDTYLWVEVYGLDALADVTSARGLPQAEDWIRRLETASTSRGMRALAANAARYLQR